MTLEEIRKEVSYDLVIPDDVHYATLILEAFTAIDNIVNPPCL